MRDEDREMLQRIRKLLDEKGISGYQLSKDTGMSGMAVYRWLKGTGVPSLKSIKIIADYFGVEESWIVFGDK